jgi:GT2 family glycosyltransferase
MGQNGGKNRGTVYADNIMNNVLVVVNYNDAETTAGFVDMALKCECIDRLIVVDNCSTDDSFDKLSQLRSQKVSVLRTPRNGGYAYGNNYGCDHAVKNFEPGIIFIANPDVVFDNDTVISMERFLMDDSTIGVAAPLVNRGYNAWNRVGFAGVIESLFLIWFSLDKRALKDRLLRSGNEYERVAVVEGSFFAITADAYKRCKGFDDRTFLYYEEIILAHRLAEQGLGEAVLTQRRYEHFHSTSIKKHYGNKRSAYKNYHSSILVYLDNYIRIGIFRRTVFEICYFLGYMERVIYDLIMRVRHLLRERG